MILNQNLFIKFDMLYSNISSKTSNSAIFYSSVFIALFAVLFTHPFLRYPYDWVYHITHIDDFHNSNTIPAGRFIWHFLWAKIFDILSIPPKELFLRTKIIHITQTYIALFCVFVYCKVVIRNIFTNIDIHINRCLSLWGTLIWYTIFATFSMHYHLVWNMWYSVNYQITLPLFWYILALTIILLFEKPSKFKGIILFLQIIILSRFILQAHSMEFLYYLMHLIVLTILYVNQLNKIPKRYFFFFFAFLALLTIIALNYQPERAPIFDYLNPAKWPTLYNSIIDKGHDLVKGLNRASASMNSLIIFSLIVATGMVLYTIYLNRFHKKDVCFDTRKFLYVFLSSLFVLIPINTISAGFFAMLTHMYVVNRLYYSASIFIILPVAIYFFIVQLKFINNPTRLINTTLFAILCIVTVISFFTPNQAYFKNLISVKDSFSEKKVGFNLSEKQIDNIGEMIMNYKRKTNDKKELLFFARTDIAFVIKYIYREPVFWEPVFWVDRTTNPDYLQDYQKALHEKKYQNKRLILISPPISFPSFNLYY